MSACGPGLSDPTPFGQENLPDIPSHRANDRSEALGFYADGALRNAVAMPEESPFHVKLFRPRKRAWGTATLIDTILGAALTFRRSFPDGDRVQVGDIAAEYGGQLSLHDSHQNGLDADIAYLRANHHELDPNAWGDRGFEEIFVKSRRVTKNFDQTRNWFLLRSVVARGNISRIFVDPEIKRLFCKQSAKIEPMLSEDIRTEVLRRLRPYPNHDDHFHMRVKCPETSPKCLAQEEPPQGSGCNSIDSYDLFEHDEMLGRD
ncbi:MAG: penicillin-insensitive murein endopeptidase [Bdellovibrionales bacterium]|nr:penicillin-insensitive murein endopeptidase [Bdellovibrionales bacterium]